MPRRGKTSQKSFLPLWGLLAVYILFGSFSVLFVRGLWLGVPVYLQSHASANWPAAEATIVSSTVDREATNQGTSVTYSAAVIYRFAVNGRPYTGGRVRFGMEGDSSETTQHAVSRRFTPGSTVPVYYNPANPAENTLLAGPGEQGFAGLWLTVGLLALCLLGVGVATAAYRVARRG